MDKVSMIFLTFLFTTFLYVGAVSNLWDPEKRKVKTKYLVYSKYAWFKLKGMRVGGLKEGDTKHLIQRLELISQVQNMYLNLLDKNYQQLNLYKLEKALIS